MASGALRALTVEHLRGAVRPFTLTFEEGKKLTIVYGENGTGKSTICDAFELIGNGKVGSLENRGLGRTSRYWHSVGKQPADVAVTLETADATCRATIERNGVVAFPPEHHPRVVVLRRAQILQLIEARPGDRYAAVQPFIDVSAVEASEANLRNLIRDVERARDVAVARLGENRETLHQFWEVAGRPGRDPLAWAAAEVERGSGSDDAVIARIDALLAAFASLGTYPERMRGAAGSYHAARARHDEANLALGAQLAATTPEAGEVVELLEAALRYFPPDRDTAACPLCESPDHAAGLAARVRERLGAFATLQEARSTLSARQADLQRAERQLQELRQSARLDVDRFEAYRAAADWPADVPLPDDPAPGSLNALAAWLDEHAGLPDAWRRAQAVRHDRRHFVDTLRRVLATTDENTAIQRELNVLVPRLRRAVVVCQEERRRFTDAALAAIAAEVGRLYEVVHPGEGLNSISLALDPSRRASLDIGAQFGGQGSAPPQAYFSDSHLDTLGLCIFLALTGLDAPQDTILVLDDVLASVDEPHADRLLEMLHAEAARFRHCILTTHYRPWTSRDRWGALERGQCQFVELSRWTPADGLTLLRSRPDVDRPRQRHAAERPG